MITVLSPTLLASVDYERKTGKTIKHRLFFLIGSYQISDVLCAWEACQQDKLSHLDCLSVQLISPLPALWKSPSLTGELQEKAKRKGGEGGGDKEKK